jgi:hypothetical protein
MAVGATHVARGLRGDWNPNDRPGDLTGRKYLQQADQKILRDDAIRETRNALIGNEPLEVVSTPGGRSFAIPSEVCAHLRRTGAEED